MEQVSKIDALLKILADAGRKDDAVKLLQVLYDKDISDTMIARMLSTSQYQIERKAVRRWRRRNTLH